MLHICRGFSLKSDYNMIQRIQSIYLLAALVITIALFFLPMATKSTTDQSRSVVCKMELTRNFFYNETNAIQKESGFLFIGDIINGILIFITLFMFKNRKRQILIGKIGLLLSCIFIAIFFLLSDQVDKRFSFPVTTFYQAGIYFAVIQVILIWLAISAIKKDEELVRSADRLR